MKTKKLVMFTALVLGAIIFVGCARKPALPSTPKESTQEEAQKEAARGPQIKVSDQEIKDNSVVVEGVNANEASWVVIHADNSGVPGVVLGQTKVETGETEDVVVRIDSSKATTKLYAMLHKDAGLSNVYEFPGEDVPVKDGDAVVNVSFNIISQVMEKTKVTPTPENKDTSMEKKVEPVERIKVFIMNAEKFKFTPSILTVDKGDIVRLTITSKDADHGISIGDFGVSETIKAGTTKTVEFIADKTGTFTFQCSVYCGEGHPSMKGTLIVK